MFCYCCVRTLFMNASKNTGNVNMQYRKKEIEVATYFCTLESLDLMIQSLLLLYVNPCFLLVEIEKQQSSKMLYACKCNNTHATCCLRLS